MGRNVTNETGRVAPQNVYCISSVIRQELFSFQNNPKYLDPSYKMDLDLGDCLGRLKIMLLHNFTGMI